MIDGFDIRYLGPDSRPASRWNSCNGQLSRQITTTHIYQLTAKRAGDFTIPAFNIDVNGKTYKTQPIALKVEKAALAAMPAVADDDKRPADRRAQHIASGTAYRRRGTARRTQPLYRSRHARAVRANARTQRRRFYQAKDAPARSEQDRASQWPRVEGRLVPHGHHAGQSEQKITVGPCEDFNSSRKVPQTRGHGGPRDPFDSFFSDPFFSGMRSQQRELKIDRARQWNST